MISPPGQDATAVGISKFVIVGHIFDESDSDVAENPDVNEDSAMTPTIQVGSRL